MNCSRLIPCLGIVACSIALVPGLTVVPRPAHRHRPDGNAAAIAERIGLTPEVLLASGLTPADGTIMATRLRAAEAEQSQLIASQQSLEIATARLSEINLQIAHSPGDEPLRLHARQAAADIRTARRAVRAAKTALFAAASRGMSPQALSALRSCRVAAARHVPRPFLAASCSPEEWSLIESAVVAEQRALQRGESVPESAAARLAQFRAQAAVVQAGQAISTQLAAMRAAFQS